MAAHIIVAIVLLFITVAMTTGVDWGKTGGEKTKSAITALVLAGIMGALIGWGSTLLT